MLSGGSEGGDWGFRRGGRGAADLAAAAHSESHPNRDRRDSRGSVRWKCVAFVADTLHAACSACHDSCNNRHCFAQRLIWLLPRGQAPGLSYRHALCGQLTGREACDRIRYTVSFRGNRIARCDPVDQFRVCLELLVVGNACEYSSRGSVWILAKLTGRLRKMDLAAAAFVVIVTMVLSCGGFAASQDTNPTGPFAMRIACGATVDTIANETGFSWSKDVGFTGGKSGPLTTVNRISTHLNTVRYFETSHGPENCYNISVPSGHYLTRFFFSFGDDDNAGKEPVFEVSIEGTLVYSLTPGWSSIVDNEYADSLLHVTDGAATVCFHSSGHGNPVIASLEVLQLYVDAYNMGASANLNVVMRTIKRVSAGAEQSGYGSRMKADIWGGDRYWATDKTLFAPGSSVSVLHTHLNITNFGNPPNIYPEAIYRSATTTSPLNKLLYTIPVLPNQNYSIWLHFAEVDPLVTAPDMRVFDVVVNNASLFQGVDIVKMAGAPLRSVILNKTVMVESRTLTLSFVPIKGAVAVNAFEVFQIIQREYATFNENVWALKDIKQSLELPARLGWNGDPCVPPVHPWYGTKCTFNTTTGAWFVSQLALDSQGIRGELGDNWVALRQLQSLNLSNNLLVGALPSSFGNMTSLTALDLSHNRLNGTIAASLGQLPNLQQLLLNDNLLEGEVPFTLGALPVRGALLNVANNPGLCGIGIGPCSRVSPAQRAGIITGIIVAVVALVAGAFFFWKKYSAMAAGKAQRLPRDAPYAKARTTFVRDVQMARSALQNHFSRPAPAYQEATPLNPY